MAKSYTLTPHDWKTLLRMVLTLKQHMLWLSDCRELCVVASIENLNREIAVNYEQFAGEKKLHRSHDSDRASQGHLFAVKEVAVKAVVKIPESGRTSSESFVFATVLQGPGELYTNFIDRLQNIVQ